MEPQAQPADPQIEGLRGASTGVIRHEHVHRFEGSVAVSHSKIPNGQWNEDDVESSVIAHVEGQEPEEEYFYEEEDRYDESAECAEFADDDEEGDGGIML